MLEHTCETYLIPIRSIGKSKAMELILTGDMLNAEQAERAGLVSSIVPADTLVDHAVKTLKTDLLFLELIVRVMI